MRRISRRDFIKKLSGLGICALGGGAFLSFAMREPTSRVKEQVFQEIELTEGEDYRNLEGRLV